MTDGEFRRKYAWPPPGKPGVLLPEWCRKGILSIASIVRANPLTILLPEYILKKKLLKSAAWCYLCG